MIYELEIREHLNKMFKKMEGMNKFVLKIIDKKIKEIIRYPYHYKSLKAPLQNVRRVHIQKHFVLLYSINEKEKKIVLEDFAHHDKIYS